MFRLIRKWLHLDVIEAQLKATYKYTRVVHSVVNYNAALATAMRREMKERFMSQELQLQQILVLLRSVASGVAQIVQRVNVIPSVDNPAIQDEIDTIRQIGQQMSDDINTVLNPPVATGASVQAPGGAEVPVNAGNEHMVLGGTTSETPKVEIDPNAHPAGGTSSASGWIDKKLAGNVGPTFEEYIGQGYARENYPPTGYRALDTQGWRQEQKRHQQELEEEERARADFEAAVADKALEDAEAAKLKPLPVVREERTRVGQRRREQIPLGEAPFTVEQRVAPVDRRQGIEVTNDEPVPPVM